MSIATVFVGPGTILLEIDTPDRRGEMTLLWVLVGLGALYLGFALVRVLTAGPDWRRLRRLRDLAIGSGLIALPLAVMSGVAPWAAAVAVWSLPAIAILFDHHFFVPRVAPLHDHDGPLLRTQFLRVILDTDAAILDGDIIRGKFKGRRLSELSSGQLEAIMEEAASDLDSVAILRRVLMKSGAGRDQAEDLGRDRAKRRHRDTDGSSGPRPRAGAMEVAEACRVLGVSPDVDKAGILAAHRRLMKLVHPDKGGSDYFAAKLNEARDVLLDR